MSIDKTAQPLTYDAFWIIFLHQEASVRSIYRVGTDPTVYRAVRHKTAAIFALLSLIFVLVFPTLAGAMTGYVMKTDPYVKDAPGEDGNYIRFDEFDFVAYVVHDAWRIGKTGDWLIPQPAGSFPGYANLGRTTPIFAIENSKPTQMSSYDGSIDTQSLLATATHYVLEYGLHGTHNAPSVWPDAEAQVKLPAPALNITAYYLFSGNLQELQISDRLLPQNTSQIMYMQANRTYDLAYVNANGRCQSKADDKVYQWGFSYIQVFIMTLVLILWTLGTWLVWLQAHINLPPRNDEQTGDFLVPKETLQAPRGYNGVLQLAAAIQDDADSLGADPAELTPGEARAQMQAHARGARVFVSLQPKLSFYPSFTSNRSSRTKPGVSLAGYLWSRIKKIKWWAAVFFLYSTNVFSAIFYQLLFSTILFPVWPLIAISWLACFGAYSFLFLGGMRWLWLYVPCTGALIGVAWCYAIGGFKVMRF
ncbi:hypothetical protein B0J18DRAFT_137439 [Chaetomium sp. MPI-SDFR-AT-0129]|nr:hypothetical protein B0J18DRAFT_137439 [Chaetomium sp. MPI-SDFR-AT-0129]